MITKHNVIAMYNICVTCDKCQTIMNSGVYDKYTNTYLSTCPNCGYVENTGSVCYPYTQYEYETKGTPIMDSYNNLDELYLNKWVAFTRGPVDTTIYHARIISIDNNKDGLTFEVKPNGHGWGTKLITYNDIIGIYNSKKECYEYDPVHKFRSELKNKGR